MVLDVLFNLYAPHFFISKTSILFTHKKEINTDIYYNMDEPQKHYAMWKKPDTKDHVLHDFIFMKHPR